MSFRHSRLALAGIFVALAAVYIVEALLHHSPWIFFDELDYSTNAQRIAELGTPPGGKPFHLCPKCSSPCQAIGVVEPPKKKSLLEKFKETVRLPFKRPKPGGE